VTEGANQPARMAAIGALVVGLVVLVIVFAASLGGGDGSDGGPRGGRAAKTRQDRAARIYVVKPGDTLTTIAAKTGIGVEELQSLNPDIDPQVLRSGQRVRLR
jgi:LysM domain